MKRIGFLGTVINPLKPSSVAPELHGDLPQGHELKAFPTRVGAFPSTEVEKAMQAIGFLDAGLRAAEDGCDAMVIDSLGDYGIEALHDALGVPVIGAGAAGLAASSRGQRRFAIVTVWPESMNFVPLALMQKRRVEELCVGIRNVADDSVLDRLAGPDGYLEQVHRGNDEIIARILKAIDECVAEGAQAIMLGCTCMSPIAARVAAKVDVPVINPLREAAVLAVRQAAESVPGERIRTGRVSTIRAMVEAISHEPAEDCPVCVIAAD